MLPGLVDCLLTLGGIPPLGIEGGSVYLVVSVVLLSDFVVTGGTSLGFAILGRSGLWSPRNVKLSLSLFLSCRKGERHTSEEISILVALRLSPDSERLVSRHSKGLLDERFLKQRGLCRVFPMTTLCP